MCKLPHAKDFTPDFGFGFCGMAAVFTSKGGVVFVVGEKGRLDFRVTAPPFRRKGGSCGGYLIVKPT